MALPKPTIKRDKDVVGYDFEHPYEPGTVGVNLDFYLEITKSTKSIILYTPRGYSYVAFSNKEFLELVEIIKAETHTDAL